MSAMLRRESGKKGFNNLTLQPPASGNSTVPPATKNVSQLPKPESDIITEDFDLKAESDNIN